MAEQCTWENCTETATHKQVASDGKVWANLCDSHHAKLDNELLDVKKVPGNWIKAQGGSKKAAKRMSDETTPALTKLMATLNRKRRVR